MSDEVQPLASPFGKYAAVITHDGAHIMALSVAVKKQDLTTATVDGGDTWVRSQAELNELLAMLTRAGFATQKTIYASNHKQHAKDDALALAATL